jgi:hypothetical protein
MITWARINERVIANALVDPIGIGKSAFYEQVTVNVFLP